MEELDLKELFELFMSKIFQIILIVVIAIGIGIIYTLGFVNPKYSAKTTIVLATAGESDKSITTTDVTLNSKLVSTYSEIVKSDSVIGLVIDNLNLDMPPKTLKGAVSVSAVEDADIIRITVTTEDAEESTRIANEIAKVFSDKIKEIYKIDNINILDQAKPDYTPSNINHTKDIAIFAFGGIVIAVGYVLIMNMLDTTIKSAEDIEKGMGLPVLVSIPLIDGISNNKKGGRR